MEAIQVENAETWCLTLFIIVVYEISIFKIMKEKKNKSVWISALQTELSFLLLHHKLLVAVDRMGELMLGSRLG